MAAVLLMLDQPTLAAEVVVAEWLMAAQTKQGELAVQE
jgi:hypothetical protein